MKLYNRNQKGIMIAMLALFVCTLGFVQETKAQDPMKEAKVITEVDQKPMPVGGMEALYAYFLNNLKYPELAKTKKVEGTVVATFLVQKDGSISDVEILRGIGAGCDEESLRIIQGMDDWIPGKIKEEAVVTRMTLPVKFKL